MKNKLLILFVLFSFVGFAQQDGLIRQSQIRGLEDTLSGITGNYVPYENATKTIDLNGQNLEHVGKLNVDSNATFQQDIYANYLETRSSKDTISARIKAELTVEGSWVGLSIGSTLGQYEQKSAIIFERDNNRTLDTRGRMHFAVDTINDQHPVNLGDSKMVLDRDKLILGRTADSTGHKLQVFGSGYIDSILVVNGAPVDSFDVLRLTDIQSGNYSAKFDTLTINNDTITSLNFVPYEGADSTINLNGQDLDNVQSVDAGSYLLNGDALSVGDLDGYSNLVTTNTSQSITAKKDFTYKSSSEHKIWDVSRLDDSFPAIFGYTGSSFFFDIESTMNLIIRNGGLDVSSNISAVDANLSGDLDVIGDISAESANITGTATATKFIKSGSSVDSVLLGNGTAKAISDISGVWNTDTNGANYQDGNIAVGTTSSAVWRGYFQGSSGIGGASGISSTYYGLSGESTSGIGVGGFSSSGEGVWGQSVSGNSGLFNLGLGVKVQNATGSKLLSLSQSGSEVAYVDTIGTIHGTKISSSTGTGDSLLAAEFISNSGEIAGVLIKKTEGSGVADDPAALEIELTTGDSGFIEMIKNNTTKVRIEDTGHIDLSDQSVDNYITGGTDFNIDKDGVVTCDSIAANNIGTISSKDFWSGTQAQYDALGTYDSNTLYFIND